jgi:peptidoglycan/xylan/chitin deacetylase (PgdA/CDA1 family)
MYHDVFDYSSTESGFQNVGAIKYKLSKQSFEEQIKTIAGYCEEQLINKEDIYLTFDDGGESFLTIIAPVLERYGLKGFFFISTQFIGHAGFLSAQEIIELDKRGHFIGVHSHSHPQNISLLDLDEIKYEWCHSLNILKGIISKSVQYASIPNGFFSKDSLLILRECGVKIIFSSEPKSSYKDHNGLKLIGRYTVTREMKTKDVLKLLKPYSFIKMKQFIKWRILKLVKIILGKFYFNIRTLIMNKYS